VTEAVLVAEGLVARRGGPAVVDGVSLALAPGEVVGLVGPSGSGKSTTLLLMAGLEPPDGGTVRLDGTDLAALGERALQRLRRERVALARALAVDAGVLPVDEPTAELNEGNRIRVVGLLRDAADRGAAVMVATHDPDVVDLCDRVVRLVDGGPQPNTLDEVATPAI
jgi:ABC-type lipoprotein export system ATPase subunit